MSFAVWMCLVPAAHAHHSGGDGDAITIVGLVKSVRMVNPHAVIIIEVESEAGQKEAWHVATAPPSMLQYLGWKPDTVPVGAWVEVVGRPARLNSREMDLDYLVFEDGTVLVANVPTRLQPGLSGN